jgi:phosphodiesterase/alkaline phosphatase D-like protein
VHYRFEYGPVIAGAPADLTSFTPWSALAPAQTATTVTAPLTGLISKTTYAYRLVAGLGTAGGVGTIKTFKTNDA